MLRFLGIALLMSLAALIGYGLAVATAEDGTWRLTQAAGA